MEPVASSREANARSKMKNNVNEKMTEEEIEVMDLADRQGYVVLDIDRHWFVKPQSHYIYYRHSASGHHYHLLFKPRWLSKREFFELLMQCDKKYLCSQIAQGQFKIAGLKKGRKAGNWKKTTPRLRLFTIDQRGRVHVHWQIGYGLEEIEMMRLDKVVEIVLEKSSWFEDWELKSMEELIDFWRKLPEDKKIEFIPDESYSEDQYGKWFEGVCLFKRGMKAYD